MRFVFNFPDLGEGLEEGTILEWYVKDGDKVKVGDPLVQMETDKVVADIPSPKNGVIVALHGKPGDVIQVGAPLAEIEVEGSGHVSTAVKEDPQVAATEVTVEPITEGEDAAAVVGTMEVAGNDGLLAASNEGASSLKGPSEPQRKALATPVARALAKEMGIDINRVPGSGPSGRVKREDILQFDSGVVPQPKPSGATENNAAEDVTYLPLTQIRKTIARNMLHAKHNAAHMSVFEEVEISALKAVIARYKPLYAERGVKLTYLPFIVKAVAQALKHHPQLNSQIDAENNRMIVRNRRHIAIAVDAPDGLLVPVIRDADRISIFEIATQIGTLAEKARNRKLTLEEMKEGSFSITSFGSIGGIYATPVINYPQAGILGIGRIMKTPIVKEDEIVIGNIMPLSLSVDHRIVDGGETTRFLARVMGYISDPLSLMMDES
ncbi:MAG: 2-oxo acid dehydrogenase subunit E2 [Synergistaceae bacterium]|jgi:pyruvate dehydrogenase E2 component (dihydrolipoamide acetyltransferase)|nr:2-oxo acid dehydrogenase subunit E2 [Synergistaceae bacterium]MDD4455322.1 dihydrolipoamide acetyltransferase family protein [Candidatus Methanomethylophilaceae archaeon]